MIMIRRQTLALAFGDWVWCKKCSTFLPDGSPGSALHSARCSKQVNVIRKQKKEKSLRKKKIKLLIKLDQLSGVRMGLTAISMATVIGPTPPGTGVMKPACSLADWKWTSPTTRFPLDLVSSEKETPVDPCICWLSQKEIQCTMTALIPITWLMPQSMTTAPFLIHSPFTISAFPIPTTRMSALPT